MAGWSKSFLDGWDAKQDTRGAGTIKQFLARQAYGAAGGVAAEWVHDWAVEEHGKGKGGLLGVVEDVAEETVVLIIILVASYAVEEISQDERAKLFSAGMAGRYGGETWDWVKSHLPGMGDDDDDDDEDDKPRKKKAGRLSMDGDPAVMRRVGQVIANSPDTVDELAKMVTKVMEHSGQWASADPQFAEKLARAMKQVGEKLG